MVGCPSCGAGVAKPDKALKNKTFDIEAYTCKNCEHPFRIVSEFIFSTEIYSAR